MFAKILDGLKKLLFLRSLQARIFVIILVVGLVPSVLMRYGILEKYEERSVEQRVATVQNQLMIIGNHLLSNNYFSSQAAEYSSTSRDVINAELEMISNLYEGRVMIINASLKVVKDTYGISEGKTIISEEVIMCFQGGSAWHYDKQHGYIEMTTPIIDTSAAAQDGKTNGRTVGVMLTSISNEAIVGTIETLNHNAVLLENLMLIAILAVAIILSIVLIRPFNRLTKAINEVKAGYSDASISVPDYAETIHIVDAFNQLLARMRALDESRQEFVANVSHELKTPITSMKVLADSLLDQQDVPVQLYREFLVDIAEEIDREDKTINDLLALVKMDKTAAKLNISVVNMNNLAEIILKRLRPIARKNDIEVNLVSAREVLAEVDEVKMSLILTNLVENAIKYNKEHGEVTVTLDADHQFFTVEVADTGIGIPEDAMLQIYERFYRVDKSHSREIGGTGLGLAITKSAIRLHRGTIRAESKLGEGTRFLVKMPLIHGST